MNNLVFFLFLVIFGCSAQSDKTHAQSPQNEKEKAISNFRSEMKQLCDSSAYYFDLALREIENPENKKIISENVRQKLKELEALIDAKTKSFADVANKVRLNKQEYDKALSDMNVLFQPMQEKYKELKARGAEF